MKKEIAVLMTAALVFVAPVAATNGNHNQGGNDSRHDQREARLAVDWNRVNFDQNRHQHPSATPSGTPHPTKTPHPSHTPRPSHTPHPTPPVSVPENHPPHGGFDCGKILGRVFGSFDFFHHNK